MKVKGRFAIKPHQGKEKAYTAALIGAGYKQNTYRYARVDFALFDLESGGGGAGYFSPVTEKHERGVPILLYPHAARPMVQYDGIVEVFPHVRVMISIAEGHKQVMERFGFPVPVVACGWTLCKQKPFEAVREAKRVLFGPIHPNANGWLSEELQRVNRETYTRLRKWTKENGAELVIRHVHDLAKNGLNRIAGDVKTVRGLPNGCTDEIDEADLVVGHQTFAYLAVARGKPTLMMAEDMTPTSGNSAEKLRRVAHWDAYRDLLRYPLDVLDPDLDGTIDKALRGGYVDEWRELFIGTPFDAGKFVRTVEEAVL